MEANTTITLNHLEEVRKILANLENLPRNPDVESLFAKEIFGDLSSSSQKLDNEVTERKTVKRKLSQDEDDIEIQIISNHDQFILEKCSDLETAWKILQKMRLEKGSHYSFPVTKEGAENVLKLLNTTQIENNDLINYFVFEYVLNYMETIVDEASENEIIKNSNMDDLISQYPFITERLLSRLMSSSSLIKISTSIIRSSSSFSMLKRLLVSWLSRCMLDSSSLEIVEVFVEQAPELLQDKEVLEMMARAITTAPVKTNACLKFAKWLLGLLVAIEVDMWSSESLAGLKEKVGNNKTFLKNKLKSRLDNK